MGNTVVITYQVKVDEAPKSNTIINASSIEYSYEVNPVSSEIITVNNESEIKTIVNNADLSTDFIKTVDREYADIGDTLTYTVTTTNTGNVNATDILITDELEPDVTLIPESITITDGNLKPLQYMGTVPSVGLRLTEPVAVGETIILTYQVSVTGIPSTNQISNTSNISYEYIVDNSNNTSVTESGITKPVITQIQNANLKSNFRKSVDKEYADINDILTYTITTTNTGNVIANNVKIIDDIPIGTIFNGNITVTDIDGNSIDFSGDNPSTGIIITNGVDAKNTVQVTFQVVVATIPSTQTVVNTADISYDYEVNLNTVSDGGITNEVSTKINIQILKIISKKL
ncbi:conserved repeat domain protein [[Clostridium] sordellii ATCC 9714]|nr:conserved repeat domain protein [[Clostridium] sordellii ATCC 9714] [Paeniclostridium sordellii ATCC 9714]